MGCGSSKVDETKQQKNDHSLSVDEKQRLENIASKTNIRKVYNFKKLIGSGGFGIVKLATMKLNPEKQVAIKIIEKKKLKNKLYMLLREFEVLKSLDHPNIIKFYEQYFFIREYCAGGELLESITSKKIFKEKEVGTIMQKLLSSVAHMHSRGIVHRDLKPENILLTSKNYEESELKIIDFGLSNKYANQNLQTMVGTPYYVAPEVLSGKFYNEECDLWSLGVIMYILLSGYPPFFGNNRSELFYKIENGVYTLTTADWQRISLHAKDVLINLLEKDPKKRFNCQQALKHVWFSGEDRRLSKLSVDGDQHKIDPRIINMLQNFRTTSKLKSEVMKVFINQLNEKEILQLKDQFILLDTNQTGLLKVEELQVAIKNSGMNIDEKEIQDIIQNISHDNLKDGSQSIHYTEFIAATLDQRKYLSKEKMWSLFKYFDNSDTGFITLDDLKEIFKRNGVEKSDQEIKLMIKEVDPNNDGQISFEEFQLMMKGECDLVQKIDVVN